ncbi:MAG: flavodoxin family protein [Candidatus Thorarchaeota archaeon]|nr:MAG: flavodoxin family protein [Candidatus Thorarchaeota archaeon]
MRTLLVLLSIHHKNTEKIANVMARILDAQIRTPREASPDELQDFDLVGFGSGIYDEKHHRALLEFADRIPQVTNRNAFIFSTSGVTTYADAFHTPLRERLQSKGYVIIGEFNCHGFNTNSFLRFFGGMNKARPNAEDLRNAEAFAQSLKQHPGVTPTS